MLGQDLVGRAMPLNATAPYLDSSGHQPQCKIWANDDMRIYRFASGVEGDHAGT